MAAGLGLVATYAVAVLPPVGQAVDARLMRVVAAELVHPRWAEVLLDLVAPGTVGLGVVAVAVLALLTRGFAVAAAAVLVAGVTVVGAQLLKDGLPRPWWHRRR